jgi:hypothetical protein
MEENIRHSIRIGELKFPEEIAEFALSNAEPGDVIGTYLSKGC